MSVHGRFDRLMRRVAAQRPAESPLTIFLVEAAVGEPIGTRVWWDGRAREISYTPAVGLAPLSAGGPHELFLGPAFDV